VFSLQQQNKIPSLVFFGFFFLFGMFLGYAVFSVVHEYLYSGSTGLVTSNVGNFTANVASTIACTWSNFAVNITFGAPGASLTQGTSYNASQNYNYSNGPLGNGSAVNGSLYNVTAASTNTVRVNITVKGEDLYESVGLNVLRITNVTWGSNVTFANGTYPGVTTADNMTYPGLPLNYTFDNMHKVASLLTVGSTAWYRFWLNVTNTLPAGLYIGNYTMQCTDSGTPA